MILFYIVYLTGGLLDSPFAAAVVVYVSSYFIIQERNDLKKLNILLLIIILSFVIIPYFCFNDTCEHYVIHWKSDFINNMMRLILTIFLIGFAGYQGDKVSKDLTKALYEKNKIKSNG